MYYGHVKWFVEDVTQIDGPTELTSLEWFIASTLIIFGIGLLFILDERFKDSHLAEAISRRASIFWPYVVPTIRITAGLMLVLNYFNGVVVAPNIGSVSEFPWWAAISLVSGSLLLLGLWGKIAGWLLLTLYIWSLFIYDPLAMLDHLEYVGLAWFVIATGSGRFSLDSNLFGTKNASNKVISGAQVRLLQWSGLAIIALAFNEKLLAIGLADNFLQIHEWNILISIGVSNRVFIIIAGIIEVLVGLSLLFNRAVRLTTLLTLCTMIATGTLLGLDEVVGHVFAIAIIVAAWIHPKPKQSISKRG